MKASIVDLRYKMKKILKALRRKESVHILYHGKEAGVIVPVKNPCKREIKDHPFFGMSKEGAGSPSVDEKMKRLRSGRYHAL